MSRRRIFLIGMTIATVAAILAFFWLIRSRTAITPENAARIREGMTEAEVEAILGGPPRDDVDGVVLVGEPPAKAMGGKPDRERPFGDMWLSERACILILYDDNGLVKAIDWWPTRRVEENILDKFYRWFYLQDERLGSGIFRDVASSLEYVQEASLTALRRGLERGTPFGAQTWLKRTAAALGLESSLNPTGRPTKRARADRDAGGPFGRERPP